MSEKVGHTADSDECVATCQEIAILKAQNERLREALKEMLFAYQNKDDEFPHQFETKALELAKQALEEKE